MAMNEYYTLDSEGRMIALISVLFPNLCAS